MKMKVITYPFLTNIGMRLDTVHQSRFAERRVLSDLECEFYVIFSLRCRPQLLYGFWYSHILEFGIIGHSLEEGDAKPVRISVSHSRNLGYRRERMMQRHPVDDCRSRCDSED